MAKAKTDTKTDTEKKGERGSSTPRDVFYHLLSTITLFAGVIALLTILFQYINVGIPDPLELSYTDSLMGIQISTAVIVVIWPVYILMQWLIRRDMRKNPYKQDIGVRKWLLYLTLFGAAITIIVDLIILVFNFYSGDLSIHFFLKIGATLLVAAGVFGYYIWDLVRHNAQSNVPRILAWSISAALLVVIIAGFVIVGSPATQRDLRFDSERIDNLSLIQDEVINYYAEKGTLPPSLDVLDGLTFGPPVLEDPETGDPYEYTVIDSLHFSVCATFSQDSLGTASQNGEFRAIVGNHGRDYWDHKAGRACFETTIEPDQLPPISPEI